MRMRWLGQPRAVNGMMRSMGEEYDDLPDEFVENGMCAPVREVAPARGRGPIVDEEE